MTGHSRVSAVPAGPPTVAAVLGLLFVAHPSALAQPRAPLVPEHVPLQASAQAAINAEWLSDAERKTLRVFHGVWDERDLDSPDARATVALNAWRFDDPALADPAVAAEIRAEALARQGELSGAIAVLKGVASNRAARIRAGAYEGLGDHRAAEAAVEGLVELLMNQRIDDAGELTEGVRALVVRARIQGQPARDYKTMMSLLGRAHQELDRLYWPAKLAEAGLLIAKDNRREAVAALHETLALNPRCADAWFLLGRVALESFNFDAAELAAQKLRAIDRRHPLADLLLAEARLIRDDPDGAVDLLTALLERRPKLRPALALLAAAEALRYDDDALSDALDRYGSLSPGSPVAYFVVGRHLAMNRQYEVAAQMLTEAIRRQPAWPAPRIELGLLHLQSGRDAEALEALEGVARLDPFNKRADNSLLVLKEVADYERIETAHFVIRYKPGVDKVLVDLMLEPLERMHAEVSARFGHEPPRKTVIELLPDHKRFAVRITGMPWIHTIAASTGPVIALEVPRDGPSSMHQGTFDLLRVIRHEYTHTITLSRTRNRIPHWLTEAAAVSMEEAPRDFETCKMLAGALDSGDLLDFDELKWAFVRPKRPGDRALAYGQGHWMVEFMNERFGESALVRLISLYFDGIRHEQAMARALGVTQEQFFGEFVIWAHDQIESWGFAAKPTLDQLKDLLRWADPDLAEAMRASATARLDAIANALIGRIGRPADAWTRKRPFVAQRWPALIRPLVEIDDETLADYLTEYPDHPDLLELALRRALEADRVPDEEVFDLLQRYSAARPADPFPDKRLANLWINSPTPQRAIPHLERLDRQEQKSPVLAAKLASLYRQTGELDQALKKVTRALQINAYHAPRRELAAAIAIEAGELEIARRHIEALTLIEPDRPQHHKRLAAIDRMINNR